MSLTCRVVCWLCIAVTPLQLVTADDTTADLRDTVRRPQVAASSASKPAGSSSKSSNANESSTNGWEEDDDDSGWLTGEMLYVGALAGGIAITTPFWGPPAMIGDNWSRPAQFADFPYESDDGFLVMGTPQNEEFVPQTYLATLQFETNYGTNFSGQESIGGHVLFEDAWRLGFDSRFNQLTDAAALSTYGDELWLGDANLLLRFAQSPAWLVRTGAGVNWLLDRDGEDLGVNFTYQTDWFPGEPWVVSTETDIGTLGDAWLFNFHASAGVT